MKIVRWIALAASLIVLPTGAVGAAVDTTYTLPPDQWHQIAVPAELYPPDDTLGAVIGDDLPGLVNGQDYAVFEWSLGDVHGEAQGYRALDSHDRLVPGRGYWIIQASSGPVTIDLPESAMPRAGLRMNACTGETCVVVPINDRTVGGSTAPIWAMVGAPDDAGRTFGAARVVTGNRSTTEPLCEDGCTHAESDEIQISHDLFYRWDADGGADGEGVYDQFNSDDVMPSWGGFWLGTYGTRAPLERALLFPVARVDATCPCLADGALDPDAADLVPRLVVASFSPRTGEMEEFVFSYSSPVDDDTALTGELVVGLDSVSGTGRAFCSIEARGVEPRTQIARDVDASGVAVAPVSVRVDAAAGGSTDDVAELTACANRVLDAVGPVGYATGTVRGGS